MKCLLISAGAILIAGSGACRAGSALVVEVCVQNKQPVSSFVMARAQALAAATFAEAGIHIEWLPERRCNTAPDAIRLQMDSSMPAKFGSETMAYALPYAGAGVTIHVDYCRIAENFHELYPEVLGHVMAHEIGHVLEGIARHSNDGVMKAHWGPRDYAGMKKRRLSFSPEDVELMRSHHQGLSVAVLTARNEMK